MAMVYARTVLLTSVYQPQAGRALPALYTTGRSVRVGEVPEAVAGHRRGPLPSRAAGVLRPEMEAARRSSGEC